MMCTLIFVTRNYPFFFIYILNINVYKLINNITMVKTLYILQKKKDTYNKKEIIQILEFFFSFLILQKYNKLIQLATLKINC